MTPIVRNPTKRPNEAYLADWAQLIVQANKIPGEIVVEAYTRLASATVEPREGRYQSYIEWYISGPQSRRLRAARPVPRKKMAFWLERASKGTRSTQRPTLCKQK